MSEATKQRLMRGWKVDPFVADLLEAYGILYPHQISSTSDEELGRAGLNEPEIAALRGVEKFAYKAAESVE